MYHNDKHVTSVQKEVKWTIAAALERTLKQDLMLTSSVSIILQHCPTAVIACFGLTLIVSSLDGTAYDTQKPRHALVVISNSTQFGILILRVCPMNSRIRKYR